MGISFNERIFFLFFNYFSYFIACLHEEIFLKHKKHEWIFLKHKMHMKYYTQLGVDPDRFSQNVSDFVMLYPHIVVRY